MVTAWFYNSEDLSDPQQPHHYDPDRTVSLDVLKALGIALWSIDLEGAQLEHQLDQISKERGYTAKETVGI